MNTNNLNIKDCWGLIAFVLAGLGAVGVTLQSLTVYKTKQIIQALKDAKEENNENIADSLKQEFLKLEDKMHLLSTEVQKSLGDVTESNKGINNAINTEFGMMRESVGADIIQFNQKLDAAAEALLSSNIEVKETFERSIIQGRDNYHHIQRTLRDGIRDIKSSNNKESKETQKVVSDALTIIKNNLVSNDVFDAFVSKYVETTGDLKDKINEVSEQNIKEIKSIEDKVSWINRNLSTLADNYKVINDVLDDKLVWINRNIKTLVEREPTATKPRDENEIVVPSSPITELPNAEGVEFWVEGYQEIQERKKQIEKLQKNVHSWIMDLSILGNKNFVELMKEFEEAKETEEINYHMFHRILENIDDSRVNLKHWLYQNIAQIMYKLSALEAKLDLATDEIGLNSHLVLTLDDDMSRVEASCGKKKQ